MRFLLCLSFVLVTFSCFGETTRTWTSSQGSTIEASLEEASNHQVTLLTTSGKKITLAISELAEQDQQFIKNIAKEKAGTEISGIPAVPGKISQAIQCADSDWTYHVYLPKEFHMAREWPVGFIMSASGGKGGKLLTRYIPGADHFGCILIGSVESKNKFNKSQAAVEAMAADVYQRFPVAKKSAFASGMSGGSRMAYLLSEQNDNIVAVLACGSGHGVYPDGDSYREASLRADTYVYSLIGTNCFNRTGAHESHNGFQKDCRLRFFPGKHAWAKEPLITQGMARVLGQQFLTGDTLAEHRGEYLTRLEKLALSLEDSAPWESHYLASFGSKFKEEATSTRLTEKASQLGSNPRVLLAQQAENDIKKLRDTFYSKFTYVSGDTEDLPKRTQLGNQLAAKYTDLPHGEILKLLGEKSGAPKKKKKKK